MDRALINVAHEDLTFSFAGSPSAEVGTGKCLFRAVAAATESGHAGFALLLDEAQVLRDERDRDGEHPLSMLIAAANTLQERNGVPLALVMCGLPTLPANIQHARTYSERMFRGETIDVLSGNPGPARDAFVQPLAGTGITADESLISRVLAEVEGYPFFIQLWGAELWDAANAAGIGQFTCDLLDDIEADIYRRLDEEFYAGRVETLTPGEQDLLVASAACSYPPLHAADLRQVSAKSEGNINVLMGRLTEQGVLYRKKKGIYEYTAPRFHDYLRRRAAG